MQQQKIGAQLAALQQHNARMQNLAFLNTNEAILGVSGQRYGSDRSFKAIKKKQKKMATETDRAF